MPPASSTPPRILILEADRRACASLRAFAVKGLAGASVQSMGTTLDAMLKDTDRLKSFDVILTGCDFSSDGGAGNPTLRALRALSADPDMAPVILLTESGSEYSAVQAIKAGAFDYIPKKLLSREQVIPAIERALLNRRSVGDADPAGTSLQLFGYAIRRRLASNGNVSVHVAFSAERGEEVVLKVLHRGRGALSRDVNFERFIDEFKMLYDVDDPAVAEIYDFRVTDQYCYIAMEYFPAGHLGRRLTQALPPDEALGIAIETAHALSIIHAAGIVHRDLKPGNIMLREDGTVALIDFGISQSSAEDRALEPLISGTPYYMSPEQARGEPTDERTDLYALGVMLYQMLVGEKPYVGEETEQILAQHRDAPVPQLPPALAAYQQLVDRLLAKNAAQRVPSARELVELIEGLRSDVEPGGGTTGLKGAAAPDGTDAAAGAAPAAADTSATAGGTGPAAAEAPTAAMGTGPSAGDTPAAAMGAGPTAADAPATAAATPADTDANRGPRASGESVASAEAGENAEVAEARSAG